MVGAVPSGGTRPLASEMMAARCGSPPRSRPSMTASSPIEGTPRKTLVGARHASLDALDAELTRQVEAGEVAPVLPVLGELFGLIAGTRLKRGSQSTPREQNGDRRSERAGADDHRPLRAGRRQVD